MLQRKKYCTKGLSIIYLMMLILGITLFNHDRLVIFDMSITTLFVYDAQLIFELFLMVILYQRHHELSLIWVLIMGGLLLTVLNMQFYLSITEISHFAKNYRSLDLSLYKIVMVVQEIMNILSCGLLYHHKEYRY